MTSPIAICLFEIQVAIMRCNRWFAVRSLSLLDGSDSIDAVYLSGWIPRWYYAWDHPVSVIARTAGSPINSSG
jgi:hypothetical protein